MTEVVHRFVLFTAAVAAGFAGITGLSNTFSVEVVSYIALVAAGAGIVGQSWRILFPDQATKDLTAVLKKGG